jgi:NADH-quinone oxidoreductase subunit J
MKTLEYAFFALSALLVLGGAVVTVGSRRPIRSAMGLLTSILGVCGCYLLLSAQFLAAIQLIVYAGAVVILFIFVVMLLGSAATTAPDARSAVPRYIGAGVFLLSAVSALALVIKAAAGGTEAPTVGADFGTIDRIGHELFTTKVVPFELTGALLLVAVVGALAVGRGKQVDKTLTSTSRTTGDDGGAP